VSNRQQEVVLTIASKTLCQAPYLISLTDGQICAIGAGKDACQGDSGGPMFNSNGEQVATVSFGVGCATPLVPGVYFGLNDDNLKPLTG